MKKFYIILPVHNQENTIGPIVDHWKNAVAGIEAETKLLFIDNGSSDKTFWKLHACQENNTTVEVIARPRRSYSETVLYGYNYAVKHGADYILQTLPAITCLADNVADFWNNKTNTEIVMGYNRNSPPPGKPINTAYVKLLFKVLLKVNLENTPPDMVFIKTDIIKKHLDSIPKDFQYTRLLLYVLSMKSRRSLHNVPLHVDTQVTDICSRPLPNTKDIISIKRMIQ